MAQSGFLLLLVVVLILILSKNPKALFLFLFEFISPLTLFFFYETLLKSPNRKKHNIFTDLKSHSFFTRFAFSHAATIINCSANFLFDDFVVTLIANLLLLFLGCSALDVC